MTAGTLEVVLVEVLEGWLAEDPPQCQLYPKPALRCPKRAIRRIRIECACGVTGIKFVCDECLKAVEARLIYHAECGKTQYSWTSS